MNAKEKIEELLEASEDGTITAAQVTEAGLHRSVLQEFVKSGEMYRFGRGLYVRSSAWEDDFYLLQRKYGRGIYSHDSNGTSFDYDKRNYSTSHVHMMLSIALSRMIDKCESVFFLNSENSISIAEEISKERTASPWIYNELSLADMIKIRPINCYRDEFLQFSHRAYDAVNESSSLQIKYEVDKILRSFISLSKYDLISCAKEWRANNKSFQSALDYIYLSKDIIIKQDVLIS